ITAFVMDNATNNDTMVEAFERKCREEGIPFSSNDARMRCMPHTIHLSALKLLEAIGVLTKEEKQASEGRSRGTTYQEYATESLNHDTDNNAGDTEDGADTETSTPTGLIGRAVFKLHKIVRHVRSSPQRRRRWETEVQTHSVSEKVLMLILDVKT
ncbi:hypothetical protein C8R43DRAFT_852183, partial [Mycena crocata]